MVGRIEVAAESPALAVEPAAAPTGAWVVVLTPDADAALPPQQALLTFHADGTLAAVFAAAPATADDPTPTLSPGQGVWVAGDGGGYALTIVALLLDEGRRYAGTLTIHEEGELDDTGDTYRGTFSFEVVAADGGGPTTGGGTARGTRLGIGSVADAPPATPASEVAAAAPASATVTFQDFAFDPPTLEVPVGATVTWVNRGAAPHTATGTDGGFDTGQLDSGQRGSQTFDQAGTFAYRCNVHPQMEGTIVVA